MASLRPGEVDDATYAAWHVDQRSARRQRAAAAVAGELAARGVPRATAMSALAGFNDAAAATAFARSKRRAFARAEDGGLAALRRRGFSYATARAALAATADDARMDAAAAAGTVGDDDVEPFEPPRHLA